jgi:hypothetical protein
MDASGPGIHASAEPEVVRPNDSPSGTAGSSPTAAVETLGTADASAPVARRDPRQIQQLSARDLASLLFIGKWLCGQYQLALAHFPNRSETAVSRCVQRLVQLGLIEVTRWNRIGLNMLRLRTAGARLLVARGLANETELFIRRSPVAPKDLAHHLWIVDTGLAFASLQVHFDLQPCWALRRRFAGQKVPVADLLAVNRTGSRVIAVEIDLATERTKVLSAKLAKLAEHLRAAAPDASVAIVVLTVGPQRVASLRAQNAELAVPIAVEALPKVVGRPAVPELAALLSR